jgi:hypothetical protein
LNRDVLADGTLRVVDASVLPDNIDAAISASVVAIAKGLPISVGETCPCGNDFASLDI